MLKTLSHILAYLLGALSDDIYVNTSGKDQSHCGSVTRPCRSLSFTINNVSRHNDTIRLMASAIKQIRFTLENPIIIKHSLTVSKFPAYSQNPVITYDRNVTRNQKEFYAFTIFRYVLLPEILTLKIKSVNFNVNILTALTEDISGFHLSVSILDSTISSPSHAVNFRDVSGYENVSIQMKDLVIQNGVFMFKNKRERCQPMEQFKNIIEMNNVTICNAENIALSAHGCFNVSIEKLVCSNITWKKQDFFTFKGGVLNAKNVLIKNILSKYNKSKLKGLFLIYKSVGEIRNILIKDSVEMSNIRPNKFSAVIIVQNSEVKVLNMEMKGNSFGHFARADHSYICVENMTLSENKMKWFLSIYSNSSVIIQNTTLTENSFSYEVYGIGNSSTIELNHVTFIRNKMKRLLSIYSNSHAIIQNNTLTENNISFTLCYISRSCIVKLVNNRMVGNRLEQMFFAHSSYLEIDAIFIESNTFSQLISAFECNVSFNSMKIRKNDVTISMVYLQNSAGKMNTTYIENSDNFMASAFTTTSTYLGKKYIPFEIANTQIIWSYALPVSSRPIIQLGGNISLTNVNLSITSLFETEILRYCTKDVPLLVNGRLKTFSSIYIVSSLFMSCTKARVEHIVGTFRCIPCARGTYTLESESLYTSLSFQSKNVTFGKNTNITCVDCPAGANCTESIKSKSNFYGYETKDKKLKFLTCPRGFCCTGSQCTTIKSCNKNRIGTLCGRCIDGYMESFLSNDCISICSCQNFSKFWLVYCIYALILATFFYYMKDSITLIKTAVSNFGRIFKSCTKEKENDVQTDTMISIDGAEGYLKKTSHFTMSGIFTLIVSFYQIRQLMSVDVQYKDLTDFSFITFITDCLNLEMVAVTYSSYCPISNLNAVSKLFIKTYLPTATLLIASLLNYFISEVLHFFRSSLGRLSSLKPSDRLGVCFIRVLMFSYKSMTSASLLLLKCVDVAGDQVLLIKGDMKCYQWWQIVIAVFFFTWILFFPLSLKVSFSMFMKDEISFVKFILCLMVSFAVVANNRINRNVASYDLKKTRNTYKVKEILSEIFQESYRLKTDDPNGETVFYESWRLYQRILLAIAAKFCVDPLKRITLMTPIVLLIAISYFVIKPYKPEMYILHWMEVFSILGIFVCLIHNMFRGFLYVYDIKFEDPITFVLQGFAILDMICSPICVIIYFFIIKTVYNKAKCKVKSIYNTLRRYYGGSVLLHKN